MSLLVGEALEAEGGTSGTGTAPRTAEVGAAASDPRTKQLDKDDRISFLERSVMFHDQELRELGTRVLHDGKRIEPEPLALQSAYHRQALESQLSELAALGAVEMIPVATEPEAPEPAMVEFRLAAPVLPQLAIA